MIIIAKSTLSHIIVETISQNSQWQATETKFDCLNQKEISLEEFQEYME